MVALWLSLGGVSAAGLLAAAWFSPVFKQYFVVAATVAGVATLVYGKGVHDEKLKRDAREQAVTKQVDDAVKDAVTSPKKDPFDDPSN